MRQVISQLVMVSYDSGWEHWLVERESNLMPMSHWLTELQRNIQTFIKHTSLTLASWGVRITATLSETGSCRIWSNINLQPFFESSNVDWQSFVYQVSCAGILILWLWWLSSVSSFSVWTIGTVWGFLSIVFATNMRSMYCISDKLWI